MCGIAGFWDKQGTCDEAALSRRARAMSDALRHRGPDDSGVWTDPQSGLAFSQRRLSIVDLSPAGHQPMVSSCGRYVISYNGELYNTPELRAALKDLGYRFRGHSDTEAIVEGIASWGIRETIHRARGMFAIALWDRRERRLTLVRDRLGIKPLYWGKHGSLILFGSELKALIAAGGWTPEIDRNALTGFMRFGYVPAPASIWRGIHKLEPGHIVTVDEAGHISNEVYWSAQTAVLDGIAARHHNTRADSELRDRLETLLLETVGRHMVSDVPLGAFLSGGYDSTAVVALMQAQSGRPVKTFSIGFQEAGYDEAPHAANVARHLGTDHTELYVDPERAHDIIPRLPEIYDEPFADSSQIPTFLISELTRRHVTVALSGDGGDELFAGYSRYTLARSIWNPIAPLPAWLRNAGNRAIRSVSPARWNTLLRFINLPSAGGRPGDKIHKLADMLTGGSSALYTSLMSQWKDAGAIVPGGRDEPAPVWGEALTEQMPDFLDRMQFIDLVTYLPDDILTKVDRASMAVSLEARVPLLDHKLVEFAWGLPQRVKQRGGVSKWLLREVVHRHVPRSLMERPKMGFGVPIDSWLRGPLRDWAETLLAERQIKSEGWLDSGMLQGAWDQHQSGSRNLQYPLWTALMFQAWLENQHSFLRKPAMARTFAS